MIQHECFPHDPAEAIKCGFAEADEQFLSKAKMPSATTCSIERSGSCALCVFVVDQKAYIANVGDSRAVLSTHSGAASKDLSHDHKPGDKTEERRIVLNGGHVY